MHNGRSRVFTHFLATGVALAAFAAQAITTNVSTVAELAAAITYLNERHSASDELVLAPGKYAIDNLNLDYWHTTYKRWEPSNAHLGLTAFTLRGQTGSPADVVLYLESPSTNTLMMLYSYTAKVRDLTISNFVSTTYSACGNVNANSSYSNVVMTTCSGKNGAAASSGTWRDCRFVNCQSTGYGGAVYSNVRLFGCTLENCSSERDGGAAHGGVLTDCTIRNCSSPTGGGACTCVLTNCWIEGCSATVGGGVSSSTLYGCVVSNNTATSDGGGLHSLTGGLYHAANCLIVDNSAGGCGGGAATSVMTNCLVAGNTAKSYGGGAYGASGKVAQYVLTDCVVSNNLVQNKDVTVNGGGVAYATVNGGRVTMNLVCVDDAGKSVYACGGGIFAGRAEGVTIDGNAVTGICKNTQGGGVYNATLLRCTVMNNLSQTLGPGVCGGAATDCVISNNVSVTANAGIRDVRLAGCTLYESSIDSQGWVVDTKVCNYTNGNVIAKGANIVVSDADRWFAGPLNLVSTYGAFTNCLFVGNRLSMANAALFYGTKNKVTLLSSCTVADNSAPYTHGGFTDSNNAMFQAVNSIFSGNYADDGVSPRDVRSSYANLQFENCLIQKMYTPASLDKCNYPCSNCITNKAARFCREGDDPYRLRAPTRAIGTGVVQDWMATANDIRRDNAYPRLVAGKVDMGCYQGALPASGMMVIVR